MRRIQQPLRLITMAIMLCILALAGQLISAQADSAITPSLVISQLKITSSNGQFITLYNTTNTTLDMSKYQLEYFNSYDLSKATSSKLIALSGTLPPHGYFMVNDSALLLCYQLTIDSVSLGLSSTAGLVEVLAFNQTAPGSSVTPVLQDYVGWSKTVATGAQTLPATTNAFLQRQPIDSKNNPLVNSPGIGTWQGVQPDAVDACNLIGAGSSGSSPIQIGLSQLLPATEPAATIITLADDNLSIDNTPRPVLPATDIGLKAPEITETLPNPNGTGNDATDEFVELYNSNNVSFDLSGFGLQAGTTSLHNFTFPAGTSLPAQSFTTFSSSATGLSLSNSGGQVKLLDPFGNSISATDVYGTAKDGEAWALANGKWYWTTSATPGAANIIEQPVSAKAAKAAAKATKSGGVKAAKTAKASKGKVTSASLNPTATTTTPIHLWTLALVAGLALLYATYEYRADLANRIYQFRRYLGSRRSARE